MLAHTTEQHLRAFFQQALNGRDLARIAAMIAPDFIFFPRMTGLPNTLTGFQQMMTLVFILYPDLTFTPDLLQMQGSRVAVAWTAQAAHPGGVIGSRGVTISIGRRLCWRGVTTFQVRDGLIEALWFEQDHDSLRAQLDQLPDSLTEN